MVTFINMVITRVKNGSPDMILTPFDVKFHEKKDEIPPRACIPPYFKIFNIRNLRADIKHKNGHKPAPRGPPWSEFGMHLPTIPPKVFSCPIGVKTN